MKTRKLKVGKLYEVSHKWLIPAGYRHHDWQESELVMYLGEKKAKKLHKRFEIKHDILVDGKFLDVDTDFLRFLEPFDESRRHR
tara:strand:+ start:222 stop:473 length:252 start_codon:yes stop_codon:yes gene_type:complete